jgi:hypothetical protein
MAELAVKAAKDQRSVQFALDFMPKLFFSMDWTRLNTTIPAYGIGASSRNATSGLYLQQTFKFGSIPNYKAKTSALNSAKYDLKSAQDLLTVAVQNAYSMDDTLTKQLKIFDGVTTQLQSTFDKTIEQITKGENVNYLASEGIISFMFQNYMGIVATKVEMGKNRSQLLANLGVLTEIK